MRAHQAGSHHNQGWELFTRAILEVLAEEAKNARPPVGKQSAALGSSAAGHPGNGSPTRTGPAVSKKRPAPLPPPGKQTLMDMFAKAKRPKKDSGSSSSQPPTSPDQGGDKEERSANVPKDTATSPPLSHTGTDHHPNHASQEEDPPRPGSAGQRRGQGFAPNEEEEEDEKASQSSSRTGTADGGEAPQESQEKEAARATESRPCDVCRGIVFLAWGAQASKILAEAGITDVSID